MFVEVNTKQQNEEGQRELTFRVTEDDTGCSHCIFPGLLIGREEQGG